MFEVKPVRDKVRAQPLEQFRIGRRVACAKVIHRLDDSLAQELAPDPVDDGAREKGVLGVDHPVHQLAARVGPRSVGHFRTVRHLGREHHFRQRMGDALAGRIVPPHFHLARDRGGDALASGAHFAKKCGQLVVVLLGPLLTWMVVTLGAFHAHAEEDLAHKRAGVHRIALVAGHCHGAGLVGVALGREQFAHKGVIGHVAAEHVAQPQIQKEYRFDSHPGRVGADQVPPFDRPVVCVVGVRKDLGNPFAALVGSRIRQESAGLLSARKASDAVQCAPANKLGVRALLRGQHSQRLKAAVDEGVRLVVDWKGGEIPGGKRLCRRNHRAGHVHGPHVVDHHHRLAAQLPRLQHPVVLRGYQLLVRGGVQRQSGDILPAAIGENRRDLQR